MISLISSGQHGRLSKVLEKKNLIQRNKFKEILQQAKDENRYLSEVLLEDKTLAQDQVLEVLANYMGVTPIRLKELTISPYILNLLPKEVAEQHSVVIFKKIKETIHVATTAPENDQTINFIKKQTGLNVELFLTLPDDIKQALKKYSELSTEFDQVIESSIQEALATHASAEKMALFVPMIRMVDSIIENALSQKASDVHIEPTASNIVIRFRIDGLLRKVLELPREILPPLAARIKLMTNLKIDEHRQPQDGRIKVRFKDHDVAIRVSIMPMLNGPTIVMRLLDAKEKQFTLGRLGFNTRDLSIVKKEVVKPNGMILVTGPTGSGKTTTLYTLLRMLNHEDVNICTVEDPIEYGLNGINQTQVNPDGGITFAKGLRSLLRQDPNVIMVGEIRDNETASIAMNSAMTGHLVLSTLHTNNAFLAPQRLIEMDIQPYLAASVINMIIGQRLVRIVCPHCRIQPLLTSKPFEKFREMFNLEALHEVFHHKGLLKEKAFNELRLSLPQGCQKCRFTGYLGRIGIYEVFQIDESFGQAIFQDASYDAVRKEALKQGALTMQEDGILKVLMGLTTFEEVLRVTTA